MNDVYEYRGAADLVYAEVTVDTKETFSTGTVKDLAGLGKVSKKTASNTNTKHYDNVPAISVVSTGADEINFDVSAIPQDVLADITGQYYDESTAMMVEMERTSKYFAVGYKTKNTKGEEIYVWRLKGTFNIPDQDNETETNDANSNGQTLVYTGISTTHRFTKLGNKPGKAVNVNISKDKISSTAIEDFFESVQTPDTIVPKTPTL